MYTLSQSQLARLSGLLYLLLILTGVYGLMYVPMKLIDWNDPAVTAGNLRTHDLFFRVGILSEIACFVFFVFLPLSLYKLLSHVGRGWAATMVVLALVSIPVSFVNVVKHVDVAFLLEGHAYLDAIPTEQLHAQVMYLLASYNNASLVSNIFWGAWLFPLGVLVYKSRQIPRILGWFLIIGSFSFLVEFILVFVLSQKAAPWYVGVPGMLGEFGICLWLLIFGIRAQPAGPAASST